MITFSLDIRRPDVIVSIRADLVTLVDKVKGDIPHIFESHSSCLSERFLGSGLYNQIKERYYNQSVKSVQVIVALTDGDAENWKKINPRVCVIPDLVHLNNDCIFSDCQSKSAIFVGRFSAQKDFSSLLKIWMVVHSRHKDWKLHIYGGYGEHKNFFLNEINRLNINIEVHDPTANIFDRYKENSILLLTSVFEPFGLVLPEAMSCGLPVVAFDCPYGPAEIITDGVDGYLVKNRNIEDFADKICHLIENPELRQQMGRAGVKSSSRYEGSHIMPMWKAIFNNLVKIDA